MKNTRKLNLKETGITLVALVITIIVLLILAGVTLNLALSNNGIIQRTKEASVKTRIAVIEEQANIEYMRLKMQESLQEGDTATLKKVIDNLESKNLVDNIKRVENDEEVTVLKGITLTPENIVVRTGKTKTVEVTVNTETKPAGESYYVTIDGKDYEIILENHRIEVVDEPKDEELESGTPDFTVSATSSDGSVVKVTTGNTQNQKATLTLKGLKDGDATVKILVGGKEQKELQLSTIKPTKFTAADLTDTDTAAEMAGIYITNYAPTGNIGIGNENIAENEKWRLFGALDGTIYIISTIWISNPPAKDGESPMRHDTFSYWLDNSELLNKYGDGIIPASTRIKNLESSTGYPLTSLNSKYFEYLDYNNKTSNNENMKMVAYMMDTEIWNPVFKDSTFGNYVVGGPTIEQVFNTYNQKMGYTASTNENRRLVGDRNTFYGSSNTTTIEDDGYKISINNGTTWSQGFYKSAVSGSEYCSSYSTNRYLWVASPSCWDNRWTYSINALGDSMEAQRRGEGWGGFRPLVSLKPGVTLEKDGDDKHYKLVLPNS